MTRRGFLASSAALAALTGCVSGATHAADAEAKYPPMGKFMEVDGLKLHYTDVGEGTPLVLVHGANGNLRDWTFSMVERLSDRYRVIAFDRPGHGYSDRLPVDGAKPMAQAAHIAKGADRLGLERTLIAGHSWGGAVVTAWGLQRPEQVAGMAVISGATYPWGGDGGTLYAIGSGPLGGVLSAAARVYVSGSRIESLIGDVFSPNTPPAGYADHIGVELATRPTTFRYNADDIDQLNDNLAAQAPRYGELAMPLEVMHGDADRTVFDSIHSVPLWRDAQNANLTIFPGVGHMPHHVKEDAVVEAIDRLRVTAYSA